MTNYIISIYNALGGPNSDWRIQTAVAALLVASGIGGAIWSWRWMKKRGGS